MLATQLRRWLVRRIPITHAAAARRRAAQRRPEMLDGPAEVLEGRQLLTVSVGQPYLAFAVEPSNAIAGHSLSFTVDVMINERNRVTGRITSQVDAAFNGLCQVTPTQLGVYLNAPFNATGANGPPNAQLPAGALVSINDGVGPISAGVAALDTVGTYTLTANEVVFGQGMQIPSAVSSKFTISPFTATDHLVFVNPPSTASVGEPLSVTVAVEDEYGNIDTGVSHVPVNLLAIPGNLSTATLQAGKATFNDAFFVVGGEDILLAFASPPSGGPLVATDVVGVDGPQ